VGFCNGWVSARVGFCKMGFVDFLVETPEWVLSSSEWVLSNLEALVFTCDEEWER
jgi:hypothetical protein